MVDEKDYRDETAKLDNSVSTPWERIIKSIKVCFVCFVYLKPRLRSSNLRGLFIFIFLGFLSFLVCCVRVWLLLEVIIS